MGRVAGSRCAPTTRHRPRRGPPRLVAHGHPNRYRRLREITRWRHRQSRRGREHAAMYGWNSALGRTARGGLRRHLVPRTTPSQLPYPRYPTAPPPRGCGSAAWSIDLPAPAPSAPATGQPDTSPLPPPLPLDPVCGSQMSTPSPAQRGRRGRRGRRGSVFYIVSSFCTLAGSVPTKRNKRASPGASPPWWTISSRSSFIRVPKALR